MGIANDMMEQYHEALRERDVAEERGGRFLIQRDELADLLREVTVPTMMPPSYGWEDRVKAALAKLK